MQLGVFPGEDEWEPQADGFIFKNLSLLFQACSEEPSNRLGVLTQGRLPRSRREDSKVAPLPKTCFFILFCFFRQIKIHHRLFFSRWLLGCIPCSLGSAPVLDFYPPFARVGILKNGCDIPTSMALKNLDRWLESPGQELIFNRATTHICCHFGRVLPS